MKRRPSKSIREEILEEWRGGEEATDLNAGIHIAETFVAAILRAAGAEDGLNEEQVRATWKELAGEFIAAHTQPVSVSGGILMLRVTQPAMRFHLDQMKGDLLKRIQEQLGENRIKGIKFSHG